MTISRISSEESHLRLATNSSSMKGIMARPPPNVKKPILKKDQKRAKKSSVFCLNDLGEASVEDIIGWCG